MTRLSPAPFTPRAVLLSFGLALAALPAAAAPVRGVLPLDWSGTGVFGTGAPSIDLGIFPGGFTRYSHIATSKGQRAAGQGGRGSFGGLTTRVFRTAANRLPAPRAGVFPDAAARPDLAEYAWMLVRDDLGEDVELLFVLDPGPGAAGLPPDGPGEPAVLAAAPAAQGAAAPGPATLARSGPPGPFPADWGGAFAPAALRGNGGGSGGGNDGGAAAMPPAGPAVVPLPAAGWLLLAGLGGLVLLRRRVG